ncbi:4-hydroxy-tetrahydrodipicolinate synthase [Pseudonocardia xinjiangensis]|nr:4-hydroxy-tetrahydrodipicolinate synthase [Pseudonocardia xinjiangensis]
MTAMVTPFTPDGRALDLECAAGLATSLIDLGNDGLVVNGTTGEAPTTSDAEKAALIRTVVAAVGHRATVVAGVGTYDTEHSKRLARQAAAAGAHGILVVTPYYSRPPQYGLIAHFTAVADATELPVMLYDIPPRTAVAFEADTLCTLAAHPRIIAIKDARNDLHFCAEMISRTGLHYYSGDDPLNLPFLALGAVGFVSVIGHVAADRLRMMHDAFTDGDIEAARALHVALFPLHRAMRRVGGAVFGKLAVGLSWRDVGTTRLPLPPPTGDQVAAVAADLAEAGVPFSTAQFPRRPVAERRVPTNKASQTKQPVPIP